jgi:mannose-6-phosphate isomerase-like protein (cupin superfamily)
MSDTTGSETPGETARQLSAATESTASDTPQADGQPHDAAEPRWELWQKERTFVRALKGIYGEVYKKLLGQPRVYHAPDVPFKGGPTRFGKPIIAPQTVEITQLIESHIDVYAPGGKSQKHGHMNSAVFYILEGRGYDIHDSVRYDWQAGDVCVVENACVHQHFNGDPEHPARVLIMKAKPLFLFSHLLYQKVVEYPSDEPMPGWEHFHPED